MKQIFIGILFVFPVLGIAQTNDSVKVADGFTFSASYIGDYFYNTYGGLQQAGTFMGKAAMGVTFNTQNAGLWKGGEFTVLGQALHGKSLSEHYLGDFQVASNIDGGEHIYLHEFWFAQTFKENKITIGLQDLNVACVTSELGSNFIHSSFGIPSVIADNVPSALFPLTAFGVTLELPISDSFQVVAAVYDGKPSHFDINPYNTDWKFKKSDGILSIIELQLNPGKSSTYKLGYYNHSGLLEYNEETLQEEEIFDSNYGIYTVLDQGIWKNKHSKKSLSGFAQIMISSQEINNHNAYYGGGFVYSGLGNENSVIGLAIAHARFQQGVSKSETAVELTYNLHVCEQMSIQPDVQYVISPSGTEKELKNALVGGIRVSIEL